MSLLFFFSWSSTGKHFYRKLKPLLDGKAMLEQSTNMNQCWDIHAAPFTNYYVVSHWTASSISVFLYTTVLPTVFYTTTFCVITVKVVVVVLFEPGLKQGQWHWSTVLFLCLWMWCSDWSFQLESAIYSWFIEIFHICEQTVIPLFFYALSLFMMCTHYQELV